MKHNPLMARMISACLVLAALTIGANASRSQAINSATTTVQHNNFYIRIGGMSGPAKGYFKAVECHGLNHSVTLPDRLKPGTYAVRIADADGKIYPGMDGASVTMTSKPNASVSTASGNRTHKPFTIPKSVDKATPIMFTINAGDVDADGMIDVMMAVKGQGMPVSNGNQ